MASFQVLDVQYLAGEALDALQKSEQEVVELYLLLDGGVCRLQTDWSLESFQ